MVVLTVGILSLVAAYSSGYVATEPCDPRLERQLLADSQMERFRALSSTRASR